MRKIVLFSGLGADKRAIGKLDFSGFEVEFVEWLAPNRNEKIESYAKRISLQIKTKDPVLIGLSFGGIMAIEVSKLIETEKVILLASAKTANQIPFYFRLSGFLGLHHILPSKLLIKPNIFTYWLFGAESKSDKELLNQILINTNPDFLVWAIDKIIKWKNKFIPENLIHIHGTSDRLLPIIFVKPDIKIKSGGHFMTVNKAEEISLRIREIINAKPFLD